MRRPLAAIAVAVVALSGCGRREGPVERTTTVRASDAVAIVGTEYRFDPGTVVVSADHDQPLKIALRNRGVLAHNVKVFAGERELGGSPTFQGDETRIGELALKPGVYRLVCTVGDHEKLGMVGRLEVK